MSLLELNLDHTGMSLGITSKQDTLLPEGKFQGESLVAGGKHFQQHRYTLQPSYVANCIRENSGLVSVSFKPQNSEIRGEACNIDHSDCCESCNIKPYLHNGISFVHRNKGFLFTEYNELYMLDCDLNMKFVELRGLDAACLKDVIDIRSVQGKRIVIMTKDEIYYSSLLDGTGKTGNWTTDDVVTKPYIDFYDLGGATGKFSISASIGRNVRMVVTANLLYFLGSQGGVVTKQCNQDELYPFELTVVKDFEGLRHRDHANVKSDKLKDFLVRSKSGLGMIEADQFSFALDELDHELNRDISVYFKIKNCYGVLYEETCSPCSGDFLEDTCVTGDVLTSYTFEESVTVEGDYPVEDVEAWDEPLFFEQQGRESSHFKITTTSKYLAISHNSGVQIGDCNESCVCYNRLYLYDRRLSSGTVLHIEHKDVTMVDDDLLINSEGIIKKLVRQFDPEMPSIVFYKGLQMHNDKWTQLTEMNLSGHFDTKVDMGLFDRPVFAVHTEESSFHYRDSMDLYHQSPQRKNYGDRIRGLSLDFVVPFSGFLSSIKLNYHR